MERSLDYYADAQQVGREAFLGRYPYPFFLLHLGQIAHDEAKEAAKEQDSDEWRFHTRTSMTLPGVAADGVPLQLGQDGYRIFPLIKEKGNPWQERISIGRASNNDVVLQDNSISKLHAHLQLNNQNQWMLTDVGSRNGSRIKNNKLVPRQPMVLEYGDTVVLGGLLLSFFDAGKLYDMFSVHRKQQQQQHR